MLPRRRDRGAGARRDERCLRHRRLSQAPRSRLDLSGIATRGRARARAGLMGWFGASIKRKEDPAFLTGRGRYVDDIALPGMLHAAVLRSPHGHAAIRGIDKRAALSLPRVHAVFTHTDLPESMQRQTVPLLVPSPTIKQALMPYCLAKDEACFVGEPIAILVADSRYLAEDAAVLVAVDFEPLPAASDCADALAAGAPRAHRDSPDN